VLLSYLGLSYVQKFTSPIVNIETHNHYSDINKSIIGQIAHNI